MAADDLDLLTVRSQFLWRVVQSLMALTVSGLLAVTAFVGAQLSSSVQDFKVEMRENTARVEASTKRLQDTVVGLDKQLQRVEDTYATALRVTEIEKMLLALEWRVETLEGRTGGPRPRTRPLPP